jgi:hypothetical protein
MADAEVDYGACVRRDVIVALHIISRDVYFSLRLTALAANPRLNAGRQSGT